ncbi:MAG: hypothetical protein K1X48_05525 [Burkholderiaceae bacterium]|nr:hypothetical protein [Burkholderiaceae bacterium]
MFLRVIAGVGLAPTAPIGAALATRLARLLRTYASKHAAARRAAARRAAAIKPPRREFGTVQIEGISFGAIYEGDELIAVIPDVSRL